VVVHGVLRSDMVIRSTRHSGLFEMIDTVESAFTVVLADTPTWRIIGGNDMISCGSAVIVKSCHMVVSVIAQLPK
jgi:hypothetical protein